MELNVLIHFEDGAYWAEVKQLPGCFASGRTLDELNDALREAICLYLEDEAGTGAQPARPEIRLDELKVLVGS